jgi:hypothetical protein
MKRLSLFLFIVWSTLALAQEKGIPTKYMNDPAVDLTRNGKLLLPDEAHELYENSHGKFDLSSLNPTETSDLWKNTFVKNLPAEKLPISEMDEVTYHSPVLSPSGIFRFNILNKNGENKFYTMMLSKTVHTSLLYKSLLRKLGYQIPDIKYLPKVVVNFKDESEKKIFLSYLENVAYAGSPKNWIVEDLGDKLILQDLVVMNSNNIIYNLAFGITPDMIQGRRLLSALAVPLSIVNLTESINMLRWNTGVVANNRVTLYLDNLEEFQCTWDDARWMTRRIEKLTREDWKDIVTSTNTPKAVQQIMLEKVISRRNSAMKLFKIDAEQLPIENDLNNGLELIEGKLTEQKWPGYASRFAHGDPESPLSDSDMKSWVKSRAISTAMEIALSQINQLPFLGTDIKALNTEAYKKNMAEAVAQAAVNHTAVVTPVKAWVFPTLRGNLIFSRNLVTGTYLGTDNLVQLVDSVGVSMSAGLFAGTMGISTAKIGGTGIMPINISGGAQANYIRTYAHLRPVFNINKSLKYPFKNVFVPLVKMDYGKKLHEALSVSIDPNASKEDREAAAEKALKPFKDAMNVGESILVTDSLATNTSAQASASLYGKVLTTNLGLSAGHILISRFHVHRKSDDTFHVYKDIGNKGSVGVALSIDSLIPVLTLSFKKSAGHAKIKFFSLDFNKENPNILKNAQALRSAIVHSSTGDMEENEIKPYILKHSFRENLPSMNLLFWQWIKQNSATDISVTNPLGEEKFFRRHYYGMTQGRNYQSYVNAVINHWIGLLFSKDAGLSDATGTNPGYSFKGQAKTRFLTLDEELDSKGNVIEPFISLSRVWNGWSIDRKKAEDLLEEIRQQYKFQFYNAPVLKDTSKIFLYNIGVNILFYQKGLEHLLALDDNRIKRIFLEHQSQHSLVVNPSVEPEAENEDFDDEKYSDTGVDKFLRLIKRYKKLNLKGKDFRANKKFLKAISFMEKSVYLPGIVKLVGGEENIYVTSKITGFREGDEDGDRPIVSSSLGQFGSPRILGPVIQMQKTTDMLEGEFFINWMMQRLI